MTFLQGFQIGSNIKSGIEQKKQSQQAERQEFAKLRDQQAYKLMKDGYSKNPSGGYEKIPLGAADKEQQEREFLIQEIALQSKAYKALEGQITSIKTDSVLQDFNENADARVLQRPLNNDPKVKNFWEKLNVLHIDNIDFKNDINLLNKIGVTQEHIDNPQTLDTMRRTMWKTLGKDGKWTIQKLENVLAETNSSRRMNTKVFNTIVTSIGRLNSALKGNNIAVDEQDSNTKVQEADIKQQEADTARGQLQLNALEAENAAKNSGKEDARDIRDYLLNVRKTDISEERLDYQKEILFGAGKVTQDVNRGDIATEALIEKFGGIDNLINTDFGDETKFNDAYRLLVAIEKADGIQYTDGEQEELNYIRQLINLGDSAKDLSSDKVGLIDKVLGNAGKYLFNSVDGLVPKTDHTIFRNIVRRAFNGSQQTPSEIQATNESFGNLGQQLGPILSQLKSGLVDVKTRLTSIRRNGNPLTMHIRLGADSKKLDRIISSINERLEYLNGKQGNSQGRSGAGDPGISGAGHPATPSTPVNENVGVDSDQLDQLVEQIIQETNSN